MLRPAQLAAFSALLFAQPVFDLLLQFPQYFIASGADRTQLLIVAVTLSVVPGLLALALRQLAGLLGRPLQRASDLLLLSLFAVVFAAQLLNSWGWHDQFLLGSVAIAGLLLLGFTRTRFIPLLCSWLWPALLLVPALFLYQVLNHPQLSGNLQHYAERAEYAPTTPLPVIYLVLDELPIYSLLDQDGNIDAQRFPRFAELAAQSTWYRNASTVSDSTETALPALLSGRLPEGTAVPATYSVHPNNLFVSLAPHLEMNVQEPITRLCPTEICGDAENATRQASLPVLLTDAALIWAHRSSPPLWRRQLPPIDENWSGFSESAVGHKHFSAGRPRFEFLEQIATASEQSFNFAHIYLPHVPWKLLPSGNAYSSSNKESRLAGSVRGDLIFRWADDPIAIAVAYQRHLMQTAYTDRWLGDLIDAIRQRGLWNQALIIITADHGVSFKAGSPRRWVDDANMADIMSIPLFVKYPGQTSGTVSAANAMSIDIVPTIADQLGISLWWPTDGISLRDTRALETRQSKVFYYKVPLQDPPFARVEKPVAFMDAPETGAHREFIFGPADADQGLFDVSVDRRWLGLGVDTQSLEWADHATRLDDLQALVNYERKKQQRVPAFIRGELEGISAETTIALLVNGVIRATTTTLTSQPGRFQVLLDEQFLQPQNNRVEILLIKDQQLLRTRLVGAP